MILIGKEIIQTLQNSTFTVPNVTIKDFYSTTSVKCPQVTVDELPSNDGVYLNNQPVIVRNVFTVEIYTKDMMVGTIPTTKRDAAMTIMSEVDRVLNEVYGLTMTGEVASAPYSDASIFRAVARYVAYIDTRTNEILRGL